MMLIRNRVKALTFKDSISVSASPFWYSASANRSRIDSNFFLVFCSEVKRSLNANIFQISKVGNDKSGCDNANLFQISKVGNDKW